VIPFLSAQNQNGSGTVNFKIIKDGTVIATNTSSGGYVIATVSGNQKNSVRTLEMNRVVSLIFNADKTSGGKKKKSTPILACFSLEWSRRGSNPRPNNESIYFLHVYFVIVFR